MISRIKLVILGLALGFCLAALAYRYGFYFAGPPQTIAAYFNKPYTAALAVTTPFAYFFGNEGALEEAGSMEESSDPYWWLNSGGYLLSSHGIGETVQDELPIGNVWRIAYSLSNPEDTDNGYHPQNIFRLISRSTWRNFRQTAYFLIKKDQLSASPNRSESNGLLLFNRYLDSQNLYYAGIRVDGTAVIKKKYHGVYYTLAQVPLYMGSYDRALRPTLLPHGVWLGLRTEVTDDADGGVNIGLFVDQNRSGTWTEVLKTRDDGASYGGKAISRAGYAGIRTDFMDVQFDGWKAETIAAEQEHAH